MQIIKLQQDFYRTTARVFAAYSRNGDLVKVYDGEMVFRMQPDITAAKLLPLLPFCRNWLPGQAIGIPDGVSDQLESLRAVIASSIKRVHRTSLAADSEILVDVDILSVTEQEQFEMSNLSKDFETAVIRFYFERAES